MLTLPEDELPICWADSSLNILLIKLLLLLLLLLKSLAAGARPHTDSRRGAYIRSCMVLRKGGEGEVKEMRF